MAKRRSAVSLRKPSPAPEAEALLTETDATQVALVGTRDAAPPEPALQEAMTVEAFVSGAAEALEKAVGEVPQAKLLELLERNPAGYRELTVYLPQQLARDLSLHCMQHDLDLNRLVAAALERHLGGATSTFDKQRVAAVARALVIELAKRARRLLAARRPSWSGERAGAAAAAH